MSPTPGDSTTPNVVNLLTPNNKGNSPICQFVLNIFSIEVLFLVSLNSNFHLKLTITLGLNKIKERKRNK